MKHTVLPLPLEPAVDGPVPGARSGAAALSIVSNSCLILLKVIAGTVTGSVALLTEAKAISG